MNIAKEILANCTTELVTKGDNITRKQFDTLSIKEQVDYMNYHLSNGESITSICKRIGVPDSTIRSRFNSNGYGPYKPAIQYVPYEKASDEFIGASSNNNLANVDLINNQVLQNIVDKYTDMYNKLEDMYNWYENAVVNKDDIIDYVTPLKVDDFEGAIVPRSYKLYESIAKEFAEFCKANNKYKIQDILSQFIREGIDKYSYKSQDK